MSIKSKTATGLLALIAATACAAMPAVSAAAATTGGAAAPASKPRASRSRIHTTGIATWFGPGFYGKKTACGQTLTPSVIGVANRTLPCGTLVKVSYNGHAVTVPVLDRGPYSHIADWDLTAGAAQALEVADTVRIATRIVGIAPNSPTLGLPAGAPSPVLAGGAVAG
ncbi:MAG: rare lipoprotein [Solirubrobacteraceae bacterium]|jgi:rare lipoprotein A (peptidoglycan hydrolase)|nr:rare lipoprotein [Solirubrobacteraceae bacterium]